MTTNSLPKKKKLSMDTTVMKKKKKVVSTESTEKPVVKKVVKKKVAPAETKVVKKKKVVKKPEESEQSTALVLHTPEGKALTNTEFKSLLDSSVDDVYRLLEVNDTDNAIQLLYKRVIQSSYKMLAQIEETMETQGGTRGAYPFNAIASTLREYLVDLQSSLDKGHLAETILDNILRPMFMEMASTLVIELGVIGKEASVAMTPEKFEDFNRNVLRVGQQKIIQVMQRSYENAKLEARKALQR